MSPLPRLCFLLALVPIVALGCKRAHSFSKTEMDRARLALETSLDNWKGGFKPDRLRALPEPIEFAEEGLAKGVRLLAYQILGSEHTDLEMMRFRVKLTVQDRKGKREEREATYAVALKSPIAIGRDPYF